jgi:hypothetical protein
LCARRVFEGRDEGLRCPLEVSVCVLVRLGDRSAGGLALRSLDPIPRRHGDQTAQHNTAQHSTAQHTTPQHTTAHGVITEHARRRMLHKMRRHAAAAAAAAESNQGCTLRKQGRQAWSSQVSGTGLTGAIPLARRLNQAQRRWCPSAFLPEARDACWLRPARPRLTGCQHRSDQSAQPRKPCKQQHAAATSTTTTDTVVSETAPGYAQGAA